MIAGSERCQNCGRKSGVGFTVPDEIWKAVVPTAGTQEQQIFVLCIVCFADMADERLVEWDLVIEFHPVSLVTSARLQGVEIKPPVPIGCTPLEAKWCPVHGTCTCLDPEDRANEDCSLHSVLSWHPDVRAMA